MARIILVFAGAVLLLALGVRHLLMPGFDYLTVAGYFIAGAGLLSHGWLLRKNGKGHLVSIIIFIVGFILTIAGNYF